MNSVQKFSSRLAKAGVALLLTMAAGCVDVSGFLLIFHIFTAHMTGATVHLAQSAMEAHWRDAIHGAAVVLSFVAGSVIGRVLIEYGVRKHLRRIGSLNLLLESALIVAVMIGLNVHVHSLLWAVMLASAMGLQTATLTRVGPLTVHTTFVTGMLNKFAQLLSRGMFASYDRMRGRSAETNLAEVFQQTGYILSVWLMYLAGAGVGTWLEPAWQSRVFLFPLAVIAAAIVVDQVTPLSIEEEIEETEPGRKIPQAGQPLEERRDAA